MKLSVVIPANNEAESIGATVEAVVGALEEERIPYEVVVVDDASTDETGDIVSGSGRAQSQRAFRAV